MGKLFFVIQENKISKLATLRQALIEGEKSGITEFSLDEFNRELDIEFARNELLQGKGEVVTSDDTFFDELRSELRKRKSPDSTNDT